MILVRRLPTGRPSSGARDSRQRGGVALVEMLIVITAMAILAGAIIPEIADSIQQAKRSAMLTDLTILTGAIERYRLDHDGYAPDIIQGGVLIQLVRSTDANGDVGSGGAYPYGPYLVTKLPANPLNDDPTVTAVASNPPESLGKYSGWLYNVDSGRLWAGEAPQKSL